MKYKLIFLATIFLASCTTSNILRVYHRSYNKCEGSMPSNKKQKLLINADSSFIWTDYKDEFTKKDSSLTYGKIKSKDGNHLYVLRDTIMNNVFCLLVKGEKLYFYDCSQEKNIRYSNPFIRIL